MLLLDQEKSNVARCLVVIGAPVTAPSDRVLVVVRVRRHPVVVFLAIEAACAVPLLFSS